MKTLKDIRKEQDTQVNEKFPVIVQAYRGANYNFESALKSEAEKWVKEIKEGNTEFVDDGSIEQWIRKFFNLNEYEKGEDL